MSKDHSAAASVEREFQDFALAVNLLTTALDYADAAHRLLGPNRVLDVAVWALRYCLYQLNETGEEKN